MARRSEKRDEAKAEYCARRARGEKVNLRELAERLGVGYDLLRRWKTKDEWDSAVQRKRGGQPGNKNSKGKKNAAGNKGGAPAGNKNAEKDGAYSRLFFDRLSEEELAVAWGAPLGGVDALKHEMQVLKLREKKILDKIAEYEVAPEDTLYIGGVTDMRVPGGKPKVDGATQTMGMYTKESPFTRILKLQDALYKVQGRIAAVAGQLRQAEEYEQRMEIERQKLKIMKMRATGIVEIPDEESGAEDEIVYGESDSGMP